MSKTIVSNTIIDSLKMRRSRYDLSKKTTLNEQQLQAILEGALLHTPTAYNSQSGRLILLLKEQHDALWDIVLAALKPLVGPKEWAKTEAKVNAFKQAYGTILFFEEEAIV
jgi:predicted oxidoreductase (fatty acid repression mutant protein)